jgi:recombination protein RecR
MYPALDNLVHLLSALPGIGKRSAMRIAFHILKSDPHFAKELGTSLLHIKEQIFLCEKCGGFSESEVCDICSNTRRDQAILCVVEQPSDIFAIEDTGEFTGLYHVLMGALSPLDGIGPSDLRLSELSHRLTELPIEEILIATNPTMEGDVTAQYIADMFKNSKIHISRLSHGISTGSSIEFADKSALARSIRNRQDLE